MGSTNSCAMAVCTNSLSTPQAPHLSICYYYQELQWWWLQVLHSDQPFKEDFLMLFSPPPPHTKKNPVANVPDKFKQNDPTFSNIFTALEITPLQEINEFTGFSAGTNEHGKEL